MSAAATTCSMLAFAMRARTRSPAFRRPPCVGRLSAPCDAAAVRRPGRRAPACSPARGLASRPRASAAVRPRSRGRLLPAGPHGGTLPATFLARRAARPVVGLVVVAEPVEQPRCWRPSGPRPTQDTRRRAPPTPRRGRVVQNAVLEEPRRWARLMWIRPTHQKTRNGSGSRSTHPTGTSARPKRLTAQASSERAGDGRTGVGRTTAPRLRVRRGATGTVVAAGAAAAAGAVGAAGTASAAAPGRPGPASTAAVATSAP